MWKKKDNEVNSKQENFELHFASLKTLNSVMKDKYGKLISMLAETLVKMIQITGYHRNHCLTGNQLSNNKTFLSTF